MKIKRRNKKFTEKEKLEAYIKMVDLYMSYHLKELSKSLEELERYKMAYQEYRVGLRAQYKLGISPLECALRCKRIFAS